MAFWAHAPFPYTPFPETDNDAVLQASMRAVQICAELDCPHLVVHPRGVREDSSASQQDEWGYNIDWFGQMIPALRSTGVVCCLENLMLDAEGGRYKTSPAWNHARPANISTPSMRRPDRGRSASARIPTMPP